MAEIESISRELQLQRRSRSRAIFSDAIPRSLHGSAHQLRAMVTGLERGPMRLVAPRRRHLSAGHSPSSCMTSSLSGTQSCYLKARHGPTSSSLSSIYQASGDAATFLLLHPQSAILHLI